MTRTEKRPHKTKPWKPGIDHAIRHAGNDDYEITGGTAGCNHEWWHWSGEDRCKNCPAIRRRKSGK